MRGGLLPPHPLADQLVQPVRLLVDDGEHAGVANTIRREPDGAAWIRGDVPVREVTRQLGVDLPEGERWSTVAGLCLELARRVGMALESARLYRESQEASRLKDEFLAMISHELRTPLTAVLGWTQLAREGGVDDADLPRALATIERAARAQARLIEDLMDGSRIMAGKLHLEPRAIDLWAVVEAALDEARPAAADKRVLLSSALAGAPARGQGDASRLRQVVANLVSNALKFTPPGGEIRVEGRMEGGEAWLCVRDTGEGIAPELLPHLFERFRQGDSSTSRRHGGLGLGLSIVKELVELHGGSVSAHSDGPDHGATFVVVLPPGRPKSSPPSPAEPGAP